MSNFSLSPVDALPLVRKQAEMIARAVGARLLQAREAAGITREDLAARVGVKSCALAKYERGRYRISAGLLAVIAAILNRDVAWFFQAEDGAHA